MPKLELEEICDFSERVERVYDAVARLNAERQ